MTTNRFDHVIARQRRMMFFNLAVTLSFVAGMGASLLSLI